MTYLSEEPGDEVAKNDSFVGLMIIRGRGDSGNIPEIALPLVEELVAGAGVDEQDTRSPFDQPAAVHQMDAAAPHRIHSRLDLKVFGLHLFDFNIGLCDGMC